MGSPSRSSLVAFGVLGAICAAVSSLAMWGFTVDDALISVRYAQHVAEGVGYRFEVGASATDGVTPLPWPFVLSAFASPDPLVVLHRAKVVGVVSWIAAGIALGVAVGRFALGPFRPARAIRASALALLPLALAFPIGAWAASGMETGVATALATVAATRMPRSREVAVMAGLATAFRPELVPWAMTLAVASAIVESSDSYDARDPRPALRRVAIALVVVFLPFVACTAIRLVVFGRPAPLALAAKPSDVSHGVTYAAAATLVVLTPLAAFAPRAIVRAGGVASSIAAAFVVHVVAVVLVGGDWMPFARLLVPVAPSLVLVVVRTIASASILSTAVRSIGAVVLGALLIVRAAPQGRGVQSARDALVLRARGPLSSSRVVAALDVGWVSAATNARIVDLAGLTDPSIATLPGGHTSKRIDIEMLLSRGVDTIVIYSQPRVVEARLLAAPRFADEFEKDVTLNVGSSGSYTLYRRR